MTTTNYQIRRLLETMNRGKGITKSALSAGIDVKTARKYLVSGKLPGEMRREHTWNTRKDPFADDLMEIYPMFRENPGLEARTVFEYLRDKYPGKYQDGQLRTFQRKIKHWRATEGPAKEVFFPQKHYPGVLCASDFTHMEILGVTINGELFNHLFYHFVLTYSNWETGNVCFSESFESLSEGLQRALWRLGGVPLKHRTDRLSAAVNKECSRDEFTGRYTALLRHYDIEGATTNPESGNENGDVEQSHDGFKSALEQAFLLRGSRDFASRQEYETFACHIMDKRNSGRIRRFTEEISHLKKLPAERLNACKTISLKVGKASTINVLNNTYSVNSRLIGERIDVRIKSESLELWYGKKRVDTLPKLRGSSKSAINYRHIVDWLVRKPGAFENYRYREDLFPSTTFRIAYDMLKKKYPEKGNKKYMKILFLAAKENESNVETALKRIMERNLDPTPENVANEMQSTCENLSKIEPKVSQAQLSAYDSLLACGGER